MIRKLLAPVLAAALVLTLAGCPTEPASSGATGVVTKRKQGETRYGDATYTITVREDVSKKEDAGRVSKSVFDACQVGDKWPGCKP